MKQYRYIIDRYIVKNITNKNEILWVILLLTQFLTIATISNVLGLNKEYAALLAESFTHTLLPIRVLIPQPAVVKLSLWNFPVDFYFIHIVFYAGTD